jgi:hypothetical protein
MTGILIAVLSLAAPSDIPSKGDDAELLTEPLTDDEVKQAIRGYLATPQAKEHRWIVASGEDIEKKQVHHSKQPDYVFWGRWQVSVKTGMAVLMTDKEDRILQATIRRVAGKAAFAKGEIWIYYFKGRVSIIPIRLD